MTSALIGAPGFGAPELLLIIFVLLLLFGAKKLPEIARGSGEALRIFKSETKKPETTETTTIPPAPGEIGVRTTQQTTVTESTVQPPRPTEGSTVHDPDR